MTGINSRMAALWTPSESKHLTFLSVVVGAAAGFAAFLFIKLIGAVQLWLAHIAHWHLSAINRGILMSAPALGGLAAGWLVQRFASTHRGTGTAQVIFALRRRNGLIPIDVTLAKTLASALTIGTGGSAGPEGPAVQIGSGLGSFIGRWRRLPPEYLKTLVAAGGAAGIAAVFNAPIAGVMYALEVLLRQTASQAFAVVVLSTVTASVVSYFLVGHRIFLEAPVFTSGRPVEWIAYLALGIMCALVARFFTAIFLSVENGFNRLIRLSLPVRAMLGGLGVGVLGFFHPEVMGAGHDIVTQLLRGNSPLAMGGLFLGVILLEKMLATSFSLASGGSGGLFVPTLSMGAMLGALVGQAVHWFIPQSSPTWAYALLGMGGMFAGFTYAPITSVMLLFEMTNDYPIILPAMFVIGITTLVSRALDPESLDGHELKHKGLRLHEDAMLSALENVTVQEVMSSPVEMLPESATLRDIAQWMARSRHTGVPIGNAEGKIVGLITYNELHHAYDDSNQSPESSVAKGIMRVRFPTVHPTDSLTEAVGRMQNENVDRILVVSLDETGKAIGIITKSDIMKIYRSALK